jgi:ribosomal protein L11 methyltransferase
MCLVLLAHYLTPPQSGTILDIGSGSGILSLAALRLGLDTAIGVDIDPLTIAVAERNAVLNGLEQRAQFRQGPVEAVTGQFQVITANIYLDPLVDMMSQIVSRLAPAGVVILSGILAHQEAALQAAMHAAGLVVQRRLAEEEWVALVGQHAPQA